MVVECHSCKEKLTEVYSLPLLTKEGVGGWLAAFL